LLQVQVILLFLGFDLRGHTVKPFNRAFSPRQRHVGYPVTTKHSKRGTYDAERFLLPKP
jgi:hypothetical protein